MDANMYLCIERLMFWLMNHTLFTRFIKMDLMMNLRNVEIVSSSVVQSYSITILVRQPNCCIKNKHCINVVHM